MSTPLGARLALGALVTLVAACGDTRATADSAAPIAVRQAATPPVPDTTPTAARRDSTDRLITAAGIGPIRLGMTLDEARRANPAATFTRRSDGEGVALVSVALAPDATVVLFADEDDAEGAIDWSKRVENIETFDAAFRTSAGVHPGSLVTDVEQTYGATKVIMLSEIEARHYIEFEAQPAWLTLRLDYTGIFEGESRRTTAYAPGAKLYSIAVSSPK